MVLVAVATMLWLRSREPGVGQPLLRRPFVLLVAGIAAVTAVVLVLGTVVTGSGPHSGDPEAGRTGFDPELVSQLHADVVFLLIGLTVALLVALYAIDSPDRVRRAARDLLIVQLAQGLVGYVQYFTDLPIALVLVHMLGAVLITAFTARLVWSSAARRPSPLSSATSPPPPPADGTAVDARRRADHRFHGTSGVVGPRSGVRTPAEPRHGARHRDPLSPAPTVGAGGQFAVAEPAHRRPPSGLQTRTTAPCPVGGLPAPGGHRLGRVPGVGPGRPGVVLVVPDQPPAGEVGDDRAARLDQRLDLAPVDPRGPRCE